jgi:hypothetical protein
MAKQDNKQMVQRLQFTQHVCMALVVASILGVCGSVDAFEFNTGNEDVVIRWDNTLRYTLAQRLKGQSKDIKDSANVNDGDRNFDVGIVSSRLDLLSEADVVYKKNFGVRLSGAGWYDPIYRDRLDSNSQNNPTPNHIGNGTPVLPLGFLNGSQTNGLNSYTKDRNGGVDGELLDAFAFAKFQLGEVPLSVRVGRHTIYWGEAFFPAAGANGISYGQSPLDLAKALSMPGVELKEIFRPLNQVSFSMQPTKELVIAGQYYLQWESDIFPEGGSYLGMVDPLMNSGESTILPNILAGLGGPFATQPALWIRNSGDRTPRQARDWGLKVAYSPEALDATFGLYYRNYSDKMPQVLGTNFGALPSPPFTAGSMAPLSYCFDYKSNIDLYGISFAKNIMGVSVGSEISYRRNTPLASSWYSEGGARGDTMHAVLNFLTLLPQSVLSDGGTGILEFAYGRWNKVTSGAEYFNGMGGQNVLGLGARHAGLGNLPNNVGVDHVTRDNSNVSIYLVPEWKQIFSSVDLSMPLFFSMGMHGNSAVVLGGAEGSGSYSAGLSLDIVNKYKVNLTYASFFGTVHADPNGQINPPGLAGPGQGAGDPIALLRDRDLLSLTLKTTF